jgi:uncharacterized membrane protein YdjX (TVP38/TMEM64 family)
MQGFWRLFAVVGLALLAPVLPLVVFGDRLDALVESWLDPPPPAWGVALLTIGVLATDILLPVPSSVVSTFAGAQLGILPATAASWVGMTMSGLLGFGLAKWFGRGLVVRFSSPADIDRIDRFGSQYGLWIVVATRPLPLLAEAAVFVVGLTQVSWRRYLPPLMLSNLGIALVYSLLGHYARSQGQLVFALFASIALPLAAAVVTRLFLVPRQPQPPIPMGQANDSAPRV